MSCQRRICGVNLNYVGFLTIFLYLIHETFSQAIDDFIAGEDYPAFTEVPKGLSFTCDDKIPGYYADPETNCQVWHWCVPSIGGNTMYSFLCGIGTVFNQRTRVCDYFFKVDCQNAPSYYGVNEDLYKDEAGNYIAGKKGNSYGENDRRRLNARRKRYETTDRKDKRRRKNTSIVPVTSDNKNLTNTTKRPA